MCRVHASRRQREGTKEPPVLCEVCTNNSSTTSIPYVLPCSSLEGKSMALCHMHPFPSSPPLPLAVSESSGVEQTHLGTQPLPLHPHPHSEVCTPLQPHSPGQLLLTSTCPQGGPGPGFLSRPGKGRDASAEGSAHETSRGGLGYPLFHCSIQPLLCEGTRSSLGRGW